MAMKKATKCMTVRMRKRMTNDLRVKAMVVVGDEVSRQLELSEGQEQV
jgi:hypothetical protein